jgi:hypothetical protein
MHILKLMDFVRRGLNATCKTVGFDAPLSVVEAQHSFPCSARMRAIRLTLMATAALVSLGTLAGCGSAVTLNTSNSLVFQISPNPVAFGSVAVGQSSSLKITLTNETLSPVTISQINVSGQSFTITSQSTLPVTIASGGVYSMTAQFAPTSVGDSAGQITVTSDAASSPTTSVALTGTGSATTPPVTGLACSSTSLTGAATDACTVTVSTAAPSGGTAVSLSSNNSAVTVPSSVTVAAGSTTATFTATATAVSTAQTATLTATAGGASATLDLQLNAAAALLNANATSIAFGDVTVGSSSTQTLTLTSAGSGAVTVNSVTLTGVGYSISGSTFPATLNPGQTATVSVAFAPTAAGASTGALTVNSTSQTGAASTIALSGTGVNVAVALNWDAPASSSDPATGYNVYRATSGNSTYSRLNSGAATGTTYTDTAIQAGTTYVYYVTSVDSAGNESVPSNTASAVVP